MDINKLFRLREYIDSVSSTNVRKIKWDSETRELTIQFKDNSIYTYFNVPEAIYFNVLEGQAGTKTEGPWGGVGTYPSVGAAIHQWLIDGGFQYKKGGNIN
jgi:hypothetical protein